MEKSSKNWHVMSTYEKVFFIINIVCNISIIILASMQLIGTFEHAGNVTIPLSGLVMLSLAILQWNKNKALAIFSLCVAIFISGIYFIMIL
jgi:hypothetical protein